jgi:hypothetical protein
MDPNVSVSHLEYLCILLVASLIHGFKRFTFEIWGVPKLGPVLLLEFIPLLSGTTVRRESAPIFLWLHHISLHGCTSVCLNIWNIFISDIYGCMTFLDSKWTGIFCFDLTLTEMSSVLVYIDRGFCVLIVLWQGYPLLYCALVWASLFLIVLWQGILWCMVHWFGHPLFWL